MGILERQLNYYRQKDLEQKRIANLEKWVEHYKQLYERACKERAAFREELYEARETIKDLEEEAGRPEGVLW